MKASDALVRLVKGLAALGGVSILVMIAVTVADVIGRTAFGQPLKGAYDLMRIFGTLAIACGLPYTTAVKGHVAVEYFFLKLSRRARIVVDTANRLLVCGLFGLLCHQSIVYGFSLRRSGEVLPTLQWPMYALPWSIAFSCAVCLLVVLHNLLHPGKVLIRP